MSVKQLAPCYARVKGAGAESCKQAKKEEEKMNRSQKYRGVKESVHTPNIACTQRASTIHTSTENEKTRVS